MRRRLQADLALAGAALILAGILVAELRGPAQAAGEIPVTEISAAQQ